MTDTIIVVTAATTDVVEVAMPVTDVVEVQSGPAGPQGVPGPASGYYRHVQTAQVADWVIDHGLGQIPAVSVLIDGEVVDADVQHNSLNQATVHFSAPQTGEVVFS